MKKYAKPQVEIIEIDMEKGMLMTSPDYVRPQAMIYETPSDEID